MCEELGVTAQAWLILDNTTGKYWRGDNTMQKLEFASLAKMYTLTACLDLNEAYNIRPHMCVVQVLPSTTSGTQAELAIGKFISLQDLYYAMMLPSGNDAALNLAYYYGYILGIRDKFANYEWATRKTLSLEGKKKYAKIYYARFVAYLNDKLVREKLKHTQTHFENPHGLGDKLQRSTAWQLTHAAVLFLKNKLFCRIVETVAHTATYSDGSTQQWSNTNILLKQGFLGVKTGYTLPAGGCLCSRKILHFNDKRYDLAIVMLGCSSQETRFADTLKVIEGFIDYLRLMHY